GTRTDAANTGHRGAFAIVMAWQCNTKDFTLTSRRRLSAMMLDLAHLIRSIRRSPASAGAAVLTLALTVGAGASIFAVVDAVLLTPPPFTNPEALVILGETPIDDPAARPRAVRYSTFEAWRERAGSMASLEAFDGTNLTLTDLGAAER